MTADDTFLDRFVAFTSNTAHTDKAVKLLGPRRMILDIREPVGLDKTQGDHDAQPESSDEELYSLSTIAQAIRYRNGGKHTELSEGIHRMYGGLSMARIAFRMHGTLESIWEMLHVSGAEGWQDPRIRPLARLQAATNLLYYPFEDVAWAGALAPKLVKVDEAWWYAVSDWGWLAFCIIDMYMNVLKGRELRRLEEGIRRKLRDCAESETGPLLRQLAVIAARKRILALQQWRMVFYFPNAVHWAFHKPPFHPGVVAVLGLAEAIVGAIQAFPQPKSASA